MEKMETNKKSKEVSAKMKLKRDQELDDLRTVLDLPAGRRVFWRLLEKAGVHKSIMVTNAFVYYNAGQQDFGHYIMSEIISADDEIFYRMMRENKDSFYKGEK